MNRGIESKVILRHKTAIQRSGLSRPLRLAWEAELFSDSDSVFDYGCGKGGDLSILRQLGITCSGWDPVHLPDSVRSAADIVNLGYVVNVIEDPLERVGALRQAWELTRRVLVVSARLEVEAKGTNHQEFGDGCLTRRDTFQKFYSQHELREWINTSLSVDATAAAPGVFFVFRDEQLRQTFGAARYRRTSSPIQPTSGAQYEQHREMLDPLSAFFTDRGRLPHSSELDLTDIQRLFGSPKRAFGLIQRVTGVDQWDHIRDERTQDLLVYLALAVFTKRASFSALPFPLQCDVKAFCGTYAEACRRADELLYSAGNTATVNAACGAAPFGKLTHDALYIHNSGLSALPPILRVFEGCARNYVGVVEGANLIKLHRFKPKVSYLSYCDFDVDPHPALSGALVVPLDTFDVKYWNYKDSTNPPILHRKEEFVPSGYPGREKFSKLTKQEEKYGLFAETQRIGHREEWMNELKARGVALRGHRLVQIREPDCA